VFAFLSLVFRDLIRNFGYPQQLPLELSQVGEGLSKVGDELVFSSGLDDHIVDVGFYIFPI
jgi:hypothetical protein